MNPQFRIWKFKSICIRLIFLSSTALLPACLQTENSSSQDGSAYGDSTGSGSEEFLAARAVLVANCTGCHIYHALTEEQMLASGVIVAGDSEGSELYYRTQGSSGSGGPKDMPQGSSISATDVAKIATWIDSITP